MHPEVQVHADRSILSKPIAGVGWCSAPTRSCDWRAGAWGSAASPGRRDAPSREPDAVEGSSRRFGVDWSELVTSTDSPPKPCSVPRGYPKGRLSGRAKRYLALEEATRVHQNNRLNRFAMRYKAIARPPLVATQAKGHLQMSSSADLPIKTRSTLKDEY